MFNALFEEIEKWMRQLLSGMVTSNLTNMFADVNQKTGEIASQVGQTPQGWNGSIFSMIRNLSNSVIIPIAGMIITFIKAQYPDTLVGFEHNGFFEFYDEDARRVAERLGSRLIERETPEGTVQATGFATDRWQSNASMLWERGESIYLSGIAEDGSREEVKHLRAEDYVPENPDIDAPDLPANTLEMGMTFDVDGHQFEIESINLLYHEVRLKDLTFQEQNGFPVFRAENYDVVLQWVRDAAKSQENTADTPVKMKEIVIDLTPREEPEEAPEPPVERHNFRITDDDLGAGGPKAKFRANMDAIYLLKTLENENRLATPEEQEILSRFVGWGGIPQAFDPDVREWSGEYAEVKAALTPEEYEAARASTLNAFYTSPIAGNRCIHFTIPKLSMRQLPPCVAPCPQAISADPTGALLLRGAEGIPRRRSCGGHRRPMGRE